MDYSKLSDQEINMAVAEILFPDRPVIESKSRPPCACITGHEPSKWADYCNNPADAWPIMAENKISVMWMTTEKEWCAWANGDLEEGCWEWSYCPDEYHNDDNPLRAAMLVYLQLQEAK